MEPLLKEADRQPDGDAEWQAGARCPVTRRVGSCPVEEFKLPKNGYVKHPGGQRHLSTAENSDCAGLMFLAYHMAADLDGRVALAARCSELPLPLQGPIFAELHAHVRKVKGEQAIQHVIFVSWCLVITAAYLPNLIWWLLAPSWRSGLCFALLNECYFLNIFHVRHHKGGRLYGLRWLDASLSPLYEVIDNTFGQRPAAWHRNHHVLHHMHTNETACDPDIPATYPIIRALDSQALKGVHAAQTFYWLLLLPFSTVRFPVENLLVHGGSAVYFMLWLSLVVLVPCRHGWTWLWAFLVLYGANGAMTTYKFAVSHAHPETGSSQCSAGEGGSPADDWVRRQVEESMDWGGYLSTLFFGGINLQIEHHLAPALEPPLLWCVARGVREICERHGIRYTREPTFWHAVYRFHQHLWRMGHATPSIN